MRGYEIQHTLSNLPFNQLCFKGIVSVDHLPKKLPQHCFLIVHRQTSPSTGHWFVIFKYSKEAIEVFDSLVIPRELLTKIKNNFKCTVYSNDIKLQSSGSDTCGWFCIYYVFNRWHNLGKNFIMCTQMRITFYFY